jgi:hypothetical protein
MGIPFSLRFLAHLAAALLNISSLLRQERSE